MKRFLARTGALTAAVLFSTGVFAATEVSIPTAKGSYISWANADVVGCNVENGGSNIGSTGNRTVVTFSLNNTTQGDYVLTMGYGLAGCTATLNVELLGEVGQEVAKFSYDMPNTGSWNQNSKVSKLIENLPAGKYTLRLSASNASGYAGNWGKLAVYPVDNYWSVPNDFNVKEGVFEGCKPSGSGVGYVKNGTKATYEFVCDEDGYYSMNWNWTGPHVAHALVNVKDAATGKIESKGWYSMSKNNSFPAVCNFNDQLSKGVKTLEMTFLSGESGYLGDLTALSVAKQASVPKFAAVPGSVDITEGYYFENRMKENGNIGYVTDGCYAIYDIDAEEGLYTMAWDVTRYSSDGKVNVSVYDRTTWAEEANFDWRVPESSNYATQKVEFPNKLSAGKKLLKLTFKGDGFIMNYKNINFSKAPEGVNEVKITEVKVGKNILSLEALSALNSEVAEYTNLGNVYTAVPELTVSYIDGRSAKVNGVLDGTTALYAFEGVAGDVTKKFTVKIEGVHAYMPSADDLTSVIKFSSSGVNGSSWSDGTYTISPVNDGWNNQQFKFRPNQDITLAMPSTVKVKQLTFGKIGDNYQPGRVKSVVTNVDAQVYLPTDCDFTTGDANRYDLPVVIVNHKAGEPIVFNFESPGQPVAWLELVYENVTPTSAPILVKSEVVNPSASNHAVVKLTFDREMLPAETFVNGEAVKAKGNSTTLSFALWNLPFDAVVHFVLPAGAASDTYGNATVEDVAIDVKIGSMPNVAPMSAEDILVVGNVDEWRDALTSVNASNTNVASARRVIFVKNGEYDFGSEGQILAASNVSIIGESRDGVVLRGQREGITNPIISLAKAYNTHIQDITIQNALDYNQHKAVAVALTGGTKDVLKNVTLKSYQDTHVTGKSGYYENCSIRGNVDYICGGGDQFFANCELINEISGGYIIAPNTTADTEYGYVFSNCRIKGEGDYYLGRPWQNEPRAAFVNTVMEVLPKLAGWTGMGNDTKKSHFFEYGSVTADGAPVDLSGRISPANDPEPYVPVMSADQAEQLTVYNVLGSVDSWLPTEGAETLAAPQNLKIEEDGTLAWDEVPGATFYVVYLNGAYLAVASELRYDPEGSTVGIAPLSTLSHSFTVRAANAKGGLGQSSVQATVGGGVETAIDDVNTQNQTVEYFNIHGIRVDNPTPGVYIRRQANIINKVVVK